jgi:hypothetical protein
MLHHPFPKTVGARQARPGATRRRGRFTLADTGFRRNLRVSWALKGRWLFSMKVLTTIAKSLKNSNRRTLGVTKPRWGGELHASAR